MTALTARPVRSKCAGCLGAPYTGVIHTKQKKTNYGRLEKAGFGNPSRAGGQQGTSAARSLLRWCSQRLRALPPGTALERVHDFPQSSWRTLHFTGSPGTLWF